MASLRAPESPEVHRELVAAYAEPQRHYHTGRHVEECLAELDGARSLASEPREVELALWFHDAVYRPRSAGNEVDSAEWARRFLESIGAPSDRRDRVAALILATKHDEPLHAGDAALVVDIDLSILGRDEERYGEFERDVRREYRWVPGPLYRRKRIEVLESFLRRPSVYQLEAFRERYEESARRNLERAIGALRR